MSPKGHILIIWLSLATLSAGGSAKGKSKVEQMADSLVPLNGAAAYRRGYYLEENPHKPGGLSHGVWIKNYERAAQAQDSVRQRRFHDRALRAKDEVRHGNFLLAKARDKEYGPTLTQLRHEVVAAMRRAAGITENEDAE